MMRRTLAVLALVTLSLVACEKKEAPAPASSEAAPAAAPPAAPVAAAVAEPTVDVASLPVEEQYEAEAEREITAENLTAKLDELEKELAAP